MHRHTIPIKTKVLEPSHLLIGLFPGEGIGPEVTNVALEVLRAIEAASEGKLQFDIRKGGAIGHEAIALNGSPLSPQSIKFCEDIFADGGAVLAGPGGDRFVYECRRCFGLSHKINPLIPSAIPLAARRIREEALSNVDILVVRENMGGIYQGQWKTGMASDGTRSAHQEFSYSEAQIRRVAEVACQLSERRRGKLTIVTKPNGIPAISSLWQEVVGSVASRYSIRVNELEVDYAAFALIHEPGSFDVVVTSNLFGDVLSDVGGVLLGSRGLCYGGSFGPGAAAIYQTNHGAAFDLAGTDTANPVGHLFALAMLLEYSFGMPDLAAKIHRAVERVWLMGFRTVDLAETCCRTISTREMGNRIAELVHAEMQVLGFTGSKG